MNEEQQALIKSAAILNGMIVIDKPIENADTEGIYFFFDPYGGKNGTTPTPIKGTTYPHSQLLIDHGISAFGVSWERFDPLTDPRAMFETIHALNVLGLQVIFILNITGAYCNIYTGMDLFDVKAEAPTVGEAFCKACMKLTEAKEKERNAAEYATRM